MQSPKTVWSVSDGVYDEIKELRRPNVLLWGGPSAVGSDVTCKFWSVITGLRFTK